MQNIMQNALGEYHHVITGFVSAVSITTDYLTAGEIKKHEVHQM